MDIVKTSVAGSRMVTMKVPLFFSSLGHGVLLFFLLSLPLYRGSLNFDSFGIYNVDLVNGEGSKVRNTPPPDEAAPPKPAKPSGLKGSPVVAEREDDEKMAQPSVAQKTKAVPQAKTEPAVVKPPEEAEPKPPVSQETVEKEDAVKMVEVSEKPKPAEMAMAAEEVKPKPVEIEDVAKEQQVVPTPPKKEVVIKEKPTEDVKMVMNPVPAIKKPVEEIAKPLEVRADKRPVPEEKKVPPVPAAVETPPKPKSPETATAKTEREARPAVTGKEKGNEAAGKRSERATKETGERPHVLKVTETKTVEAGLTGIRRLVSKDLRKGTGVSSKGSISREFAGVKKTGQAVRGSPMSADKSRDAASVSQATGASPAMRGGEKAPAKAEGERAAGKGGPERNAAGVKEPSAPGKEGIVLQGKTEAKTETGRETKPALGLPVSDILLRRDIKIEIIFRDAGSKGVTTQLFRKSHPSARGRGAYEKEKRVEGVEERTENFGPGSPGTGTTRVLSVVKADRGLYTFVLENTSGEVINTGLLFSILEGKAGERIRRIKNVELSPRAVIKFSFIIPEAVFWDDESYFTGTIESSDTMTKFNDKTGLIWKEQKDY